MTLGVQRAVRALECAVACDIGAQHVRQTLREVAIEVRAIESGRQKAIVRQYPRELRALVRNLNALIAGRDTHVQRHRNALGDLAHSLKTPLAVMRATLEQDAPDARWRDTLREQVAQLDDTVRYQLQRAATVGRHVLAPPLDVLPILERVSSSLRKVYHARALGGVQELVRDRGEFVEHRRLG